MYLNESSFKDLYKSTVLAFPNTTKRQYATQPIVIEQIKFVPYFGLNTLFIKAEAINEERHYNPMVLFKKVDYNKKDCSVKTDMSICKFGKLSLESTDILLRCQCKDFKYRFNYYDHLDKSLYGSKIKKYESLGIGQPANPKEMPGMCKHLIKMFEVLRAENLFLD